MTLAEAIVDLFDDPTQVWMRVFDALEPLAQRTFLTLVTLRTPCDLEELQAVVRGQSGVTSFDSFELALRSLDDTFITIAPPPPWTHLDQGRNATDLAVDYRNPGLLDFAQALVEGTPARLAGLRPFTRFEQVDEIVDLASATLGGTHTFPRTREWVTAETAALLAEACGLYPDPPCKILGSDGLRRWADLVGITQRLKPWAAGGIAIAQPLIASGWAAALASPLNSVTRYLLRVAGNREVLRECVGIDPVDEYAHVVEGLPWSIARLEILEDLRGLQALPVDEAVLKADFHEYLRQRMSELDQEDDHESLRQEWSSLEELSYWVEDDELWGSVAYAFEERMGETAEPSQDYDEDRITAPRAEAALDVQGDDYIGALFQSLAQAED
jgi:hypothetical protein